MRTLNINSEIQERIQYKKYRVLLEKFILCPEAVLIFITVTLYLLGSGSKNYFL
jgi:hypothetical protein